MALAGWTSRLVIIRNTRPNIPQLLRTLDNSPRDPDVLHAQSDRLEDRDVPCAPQSLRDLGVIGVP